MGTTLKEEASNKEGEASNKEGAAAFRPLNHAQKTKGL
jgi:hypothetical protein